MERQMLKIQLEDESSMRQAGKEVPRQYVIIDGLKYYLSQDYVSDEYTTRDASIDQFREEIMHDTNMSSSMESHRKMTSGWVNNGILPSGNLIVNYPNSTKYGIVNEYGDVVVDFKYGSIKQIPNHPGFFIVQSDEYYDIPEVGYMKNNVSYYKGVIAEDGTELFPIKDSNIDDIGYDPKNDIIHCNNTKYHRGLLNAKGWSGYDKDIMTIPGSELETIYQLTKSQQDTFTR